MKKKKPLLRKNPEKFLFGFIKLLFVYSLSLILFAGYQVYLDLGYATSFESYIWLITTFLGLSVFLWAVATWKFPNFSSWGVLFLFLGLFTNVTWMFKVAGFIFVTSAIFGILEIFGFEIKSNIKTYWRGKKI